MVDPPPYPDSNADTGVGTPLWVKVFGIVALVLVLLVVIIMKAGVGGQHGPGRHMPSGDSPPSSVYTPPIQQEVRQP